MNQKLIKRMKAIMAEKQITQSELAQRTGIRASSISDYLNNRYEPKQDKIYLLADALGVNPAWLSGRDDDDPTDGEVRSPASVCPLTSDEETLVTNYRKLSPAGKEYVHDQVDFRLKKEAAKVKESMEIA